MNSELDSKRKKQQFLKESILDQGVSAKRFEEFVYTMKDEPFDVDNWTAGELAKVVEMFRRFEEESKLGELLVSNTLNGPKSGLQCDPIEYIEVTKYINK